MARVRRFKRRSQKKFRFTRGPKRKSFKRKSVYSPYRKVKKARRFNRGKLRLHSAFCSGASLPKETSTRVYWRGSAVIQFGNAGTSTDERYDQTFCLSRLNGPQINYGTIPNGMKGKVAYADSWIGLYESGLVTGSKIKMIIRNPLYPSNLTNVRASTDTETAKAIPADLMYGFWYVRYYYSRYQPNTLTGNPSLIVGEPITGDMTGLWSNMRDFMSDSTVTWVRDKLPRAMKMHYTRPNSDHNVNAHNQLFPMQGDGCAVTYEMEYSTRPVTLIASFSRKKHFQQPVNESNFEPIHELGNTGLYTAPTRVAPQMYVYFGYIGFNAAGDRVCTRPADRIETKQIEVQYMARIRLRDPKIEPFDGVKNPPGTNPASAAFIGEDEIAEHMDPDMIGDDDDDDDVLEETGDEVVME